jgi:hypothetical protein
MAVGDGAEPVEGFDSGRVLAIDIDTGLATSIAGIRGVYGCTGAQRGGDARFKADPPDLPEPGDPCRTSTSTLFTAQPPEPDTCDFPAASASSRTRSHVVGRHTDGSQATS